MKKELTKRKLFVFTLTWDACDKLNKLKESLIPALQDVDYTWLIKDNCSKDDTVKIASQWGDKIKVIPYKNNLQNFSAGMNYLFKEAAPQDQDLILLLNNDIIIHDKNSIKNMMNLINSNEDVGVVGAKLLYTNTDIIQHAGVIFSNNYKMPTHFRAGEKIDKHAEKNRLFQAVTGAVLLTKAEYFKNISVRHKGMDEEYHWAFDDVDLCLSINYNLNKKIVYCGKTNIFHEESFSLKKNPANKLFMSHNVNHLKNKWQKRYILDQNIYMNDPKYNLYKE